MEFDAIYRNWKKLCNYAERHEIKCTTLNPKCSFFYKMFDLPVNVGKENEHKGYSWCGGRCRWGTTEKLKHLDKYCEERNAYCYIGVAYDEVERLKKERKTYKLFPLVEWKMTENDCLNYCYNLNINWLENNVELYEILDRVSCWCCSNKNQWELYNVWKYLPHYWNKLCELQKRNKRPFKTKYSIFDIQTRFENGYIPKRRKTNEKI